MFSSVLRSISVCVCLASLFSIFTGPATSKLPLRAKIKYFSSADRHSLSSYFPPWWLQRITPKPRQLTYHPSRWNVSAFRSFSVAVFLEGKAALLFSAGFILTHPHTPLFASTAHKRRKRQLEEFLVKTRNNVFKSRSSEFALAWELPSLSFLWCLLLWN